jgi:hypothetical protein
MRTSSYHLIWALNPHIWGNFFSKKNLVRILLTWPLFDSVSNVTGSPLGIANPCQGRSLGRKSFLVAFYVFPNSKWTEGQLWTLLSRVFRSGLVVPCHHWLTMFVLSLDVWGALRGPWVTSGLPSAEPVGEGSGQLPLPNAAENWDWRVQMPSYWDYLNSFAVWWKIWY